jgi:hypothetical protein
MELRGKTRDTALVKQISSVALVTRCRWVAALCIVATLGCIQSQTSAQTWLKGTWEGTGYQIDANETWTMVLRVRGNKFVIEYPSLKCAGVWRLLDFNSRGARFRETITTGTTECANNGRVTIERLNRNQIAFRYAYSDTREVSASAILQRKQ